MAGANLQSAFAAQPSALANPVPSEGAQPGNPFEAALNSLPPESMDTPVQAQAPIEPVAAPINPFAQALEGIEEPVSAQDESMSPLPAPTGLEAVSEQLRESSTRFRNAWATSDKQQLELLKSSGIFEDVRVKNGKVQVKRPGRKGFENFDRDQAELLGDSLDASRMIFETIVENSVRIGGGVAGGMIGAGKGAAQGAVVGGVAGSVVPGAGTAIGGTAGAVTGGGLGATLGAATGTALGGAAGAITAFNMGEFVASKLGVPEDQARNKTTEASIAGVLGGGFNLMAASAARKNTAKKLRQTDIKDYIGKAKDDVLHAQEAVRELEKAGVNLNPRTGEVFLTPNQATGGSIPELVATEANLTRQPGFRLWKAEQGEAILDGYKALVSTVAKATGKTAQLGEEFQLKYQDMGDYFGKQIGMFRDIAKQEFKQVPMPVQRTMETLQPMLQQLNEGTQGILGADGKPARALMTRAENAMKMFPGLTKEQGTIVEKAFADVEKKLVKGQMTINDVDKLYTSLRKQIDNSMNTQAGSAVGKALIPIKNAIRDDYTEIIGKAVPEGQLKHYQGFLKNYSDFKAGEEELSVLLDKSALSRSALLDKLFAGKDSLRMAKSVQVIINERDPQFFRQLTSEYLMRLQHTNVVKKGSESAGDVDWAGMAKKFGRNADEGLGGEMQQLILDGAGLTRKQFDSIMHIGRMYQKTDMKNLPNEARIGVIKTVFMATFGKLLGVGGTAQINAASELATKIGKNQSMMTYLKDGGVEEVLKSMPGLKPEKASAIRQWVRDYNFIATRPLATEIRQDAQGLVVPDVQTSEQTP